MNTRNTDRRGFLRAVGRIALLGGFAGSGVYLASTNKITAPGPCNENRFCSSCNKIEDCKLPGAEKYRKNGKR